MLHLGILGAFPASDPDGLTPETGLSAPIFWLRQKDFRFYPLRVSREAASGFF
jgi:hypothetical protein